MGRDIDMTLSGSAAYACGRFYSSVIFRHGHAFRETGQGDIAVCSGAHGVWDRPGARRWDREVYL